ncbi:MAG: T9SS type A sorting domain-containing protein [bacterium]|nr:T9SS type A sorting domain-containing protein [bacterium]
MLKKLILIFLLILVCSGVSGQDCAQYDESMQYLWDFGNEPRDIIVKDDLAYVLYADESIIVLDCGSETPNQVAELSTIPFGIAPHRFLMINGDLLFLTGYNHYPEVPAILALDISDHTAPVMAGASMMGEPISVMAAGGEYLYSNFGYGGTINVYNMPTPGYPNLIGTVVIGESCRALEVRDGYLYAGSGIIGGQGRLYCFRIKTDGSLTLLGSSELMAGVYDIELKGDFAYAASGGSLSVFSVADPGNPILLAAQHSVRSNRKLGVGETTAYVAAGEWGIDMVDISDPSTPVALGSYDMGWDATGLGLIAVQGDRLYYPHDNGLRAFDITSETMIDPIGSLEGEGYHRPHVFGDLLLIPNHSAHIDFIDISNPQNPVFRSRILTPPYMWTWSRNLTHVGDTVLALNYFAEEMSYGTYLSAIDLSDPDAPVVGDWFIMGDGNYRAFREDVDNALLFVGSDGDMQSYDVSDPSSLNLLQDLTLSPYRQMLDIVLVEDYAYCTFDSDVYPNTFDFTDHGDVMSIIDVSDPAAMFKLSSVDHWSDLISDMLHQDGYLYLATEGHEGGSCKIRVFSLADPEDPQFVAEAALPFRCETLYLENNVLHAGGMLGIAAVDISDPLNPLYLGNLVTPWTNLYTAGGNGMIFSIQDELAIYPVQCGSVTAVPAPEAGDRLAVSAWPNPFNPKVNLSFSLPEAQRATVTIHDVAGRRIVTLAEGLLVEGTHQLSWSGLDDAGVPQSSGVYLVRVNGALYQTSARLVLLK